MCIYLSVRNALPMIPLSQVKVSYIPRFYRSPLKHLFSYFMHPRPPGRQGSDRQLTTNFEF